MLKVDSLSSGQVKKHLDVQKKDFDGTLVKWCAPYVSYPKLTYELVCFFREKIDEILVGDAKALRGIIDEVSAKFPDFTQYLQDRPKKSQPGFDLGVESLIEQVQGLFDYDAFSKRKNAWGAYDLVRAHGLRICPYCQLHHVNYYVSNDDGAFRMRPPLDHFYPKSIYPYLAVSLFNLIPSCTQCNSSVKRDGDPGGAVPHPMDATEVLTVDFSVLHKALQQIPTVPDDIELVVQCAGKSKAFVEFFRLQERYAWYTPEIFDMFLRKANFDQLDAQWQEAISGEIFVLGFSRTDASRRALGSCLASIARNSKLINW